MWRKLLYGAVPPLAALLCLVTIAGCRPVEQRGKLVDKLRGPGFEDETAKTLGEMRKADPENKSKWGFATKAREIEDNLGIR